MATLHLMCGLAFSGKTTVGRRVDQARLGEVRVPVLLVYGSHDGYRPQPAAGEGHAALFSGTDDLTLEFMEQTGNALTLERTAPQFRTLLSGWLCERELAHADACPQVTPPTAAPVSGAPAAAGSPADPPTVAATPPAPLPATGSELNGLGLLSLSAGALLLQVNRRPAAAR